MPNVLFAASADDWSTYRSPLQAALDEAGIDARLAAEMPAPEADYIVYAPNSGLRDFTAFARCKAVLSLWAGVETIVGNKTLTQPLARMVDPGMTRSMCEWVAGHVLRHHLGMDAHICNPEHAWAPVPPPLAEERGVCVFGLGALGASVARTLQGLGFAVSGWSRSPKRLDGIATHHGAEGLRAALSGADIAVLLMPDTPATQDFLNAETLAQLPAGAVILNPGRGPLIDDGALLAALDSGHVGHATLDVFRTEPLPRDHPYWAHPRVTVTPHIAAATRPRTASRVIAENIRRGEAGEPLLHLVDRTLGY